MNFCLLKIRSLFLSSYIFYFLNGQQRILFGKLNAMLSRSMLCAHTFFITISLGCSCKSCSPMENYNSDRMCKWTSQRTNEMNEMIWLHFTKGWWQRKKNKEKANIRKNSHFSSPLELCVALTPSFFPFRLVHFSFAIEQFSKDIQHKRMESERMRQEEGAKTKTRAKKNDFEEMKKGSSACTKFKKLLAWE